MSDLSTLYLRASYLGGGPNKHGIFHSWLLWLSSNQLSCFLTGEGNSSAHKENRKPSTTPSWSEHPLKHNNPAPKLSGPFINQPGIQHSAQSKGKGRALIPHPVVVNIDPVVEPTTIRKGKAYIQHPITDLSHPSPVIPLPIVTSSSGEVSHETPSSSTVVGTSTENHIYYDSESDAKTSDLDILLDCGSGRNVTSENIGAKCPRPCDDFDGSKPKRRRYIIDCILIPRLEQLPSDTEDRYTADYGYISPASSDVNGADAESYQTPTSIRSRVRRSKNDIAIVSRRGDEESSDGEFTGLTVGGGSAAKVVESDSIDSDFSSTSCDSSSSHDDFEGE
jgi:hypothetical protein